MSKLVFVISMLCLALATNAQNKEIPLGKSFRKARIVTTDFSKIESKKISFGETGLSYTDTNGEQKQLSYDKLSYVRYRKGNYCIHGTAIGGTFGALVAIGSLARHKANMENLGIENNESYATYGLVGAAIGAGIGFTVGYFLPKWATTKFGDNEAYLQLQPASQCTGLAVRLTF